MRIRLVLALILITIVGCKSGQVNHEDGLSWKNPRAYGTLGLPYVISEWYVVSAYRTMKSLIEEE